MSPEEQHMADRQAAAERVVADATHYKVCEGCDSVVSSNSVTCSQCHGYRFVSDPNRVINQARLLALTPQQGVSPEDLY